MHENYQDVIDQLTDFGLLIGTIESDRAKPKRVAVDLDLCPVDKEKQRYAGWYQLNTFTVDGKSYLVGSYGYWKGSDNNAQKIRWDKKVTLTPEQRQAMADQHKAAKKHALVLRNKEIEKASNRAQRTWSKLAKDGQCEYLTKKQVQAHGVRFHKTEDVMFVPMQDAKGKIYGLQIIRGPQAMANHAALMANNPKLTAKPQKQYWPAGLDKVGHYHLIGSPREVVLVAEGYATAATIFEATGLPVAVAYDANNLVPVSKALKKAYAQATVIICADDDYLQKCNACHKLTTVTNQTCTHCGHAHGKKNAGIELAQNAAMSVGGLWIAPNFINEQGQDIRNGQKLTDFNDLANHPEGGSHLVRAQIDAFTSTITVQKPAPKSLPTQTGAGEYKARSVMDLDEIAERYIMMEEGTGRTMFDTWSRNFILNSQIERQMPVKATWNDLKAHPLWASRALKQEQVAFDPTCKDTKVIENRWTGWPIKSPNLTNPEQACSKALDLLLWLTKDEDETGQLFQWILKWLAYPIQNPGAKMDSCLVFKGAQGTGKGFLFIQIFGTLYGEFFASLTQSALEDKFNSDWTDRKLFIVADEVVASSDKYRYKNQLKTLISEPVIRVNPKNMAAYQERNHFNLVFLSNEAVPVILENDDRRHCIVETPGALPQDFYYQLQDEVEAGGVHALYQYMLELDLGDFNTRTKPPMTASKEELIDLGLDSHQRFIKYWLAGDTKFPVGPVSKANLYQAYSKWSLEEGEHYKHSAKDLKPVLRKYGVLEKSADLYDSYNYDEHSKKSTRIYEPSELVFNKLDKAGIAYTPKTPDKTLTQWRTDNNMAFKTILDEQY